MLCYLYIFHSEKITINLNFFPPIQFSGVKLFSTMVVLYNTWHRA